MDIITNDNENKSRAIEALKNVIDPEIGLNVVDLGLILQLDFDKSQMDVYCSMTLTTRFCPMGESISSGVTNALQKAFPGYKIEVIVIFDPPWNASLISEEGQQLLNR
jgi:metal-sulfur cluster biosynthetic enzyme